MYVYTETSKQWTRFVFYEEVVLFYRHSQCDETIERVNLEAQANYIAYIFIVWLPYLILYSPILCNYYQ